MPSDRDFKYFRAWERIVSSLIRSDIYCQYWKSIRNVNYRFPLAIYIGNTVLIGNRKWKKKPGCRASVDSTLSEWRTHESGRMHGLRGWCKRVRPTVRRLEWGRFSARAVIKRTLFDAFFSPPRVVYLWYNESGETNWFRHEFRRHMICIHCGDIASERNDRAIILWGH